MSLRKLEGVISEIDPVKMQAKCTFPGVSDVESDWMQIMVHGVGQEERTFPVGTLVACLMDENCEDGWILGRIYPDTQELSGATEKKWKRTVAAGLVIEIDETTGNVNLQTMGKVTVNGVMIDIDGGGGVIAGVVHGLSPCPVFGGVHLCPSNTVKVSG